MTDYLFGQSISYNKKNLKFSVLHIIINISHAVAAVNRLRLFIVRNIIGRKQKIENKNIIYYRRPGKQMSVLL